MTDNVVTIGGGEFKKKQVEPSDEISEFFEQMKNIAANTSSENITVVFGPTKLIPGPFFVSTPSMTAEDILIMMTLAQSASTDNLVQELLERNEIDLKGTDDE